MPSFRAAPVRVRVPASSANLGPGFDSVGLALSIYDDVVVRVAESGLSVDVHGEGAEGLDCGEAHLVVTAMRRAFDLLGGQPRGLELVCANRIPHGSGLGSSAAAIVTGVVAAGALTVGGLSREDALALATDMEGHPDNVSASLLGGLTVSWTEAPDPVAGHGGGRGRGARPPLPRVGVAQPALSPRLTPVALRPGGTQATEAARALLPDTVPHAVAAVAAARAALLVCALGGQDDLLLPGTEDVLHQPFRLPLQPGAVELVGALRAAGLAAVLSGSGPTLLVLAPDADAAQRALGLCPEGWTGQVLAVDTVGAQVLPLQA